MKTKVSIVLSVLVACFIWVHGALAETYGYIDSKSNDVTDFGVLGAQYNGGTSGAAISGVNSTQGVGGFFLTQGTRDFASGVEGYAMASSGKTYGGYLATQATRA